MHQSTRKQSRRRLVGSSYGTYTEDNMIDTWTVTSESN
jgi:hypothetical protein